MSKKNQIKFLRRSCTNVILCIDKNTNTQMKIYKKTAISYSQLQNTITFLDNCGIITREKGLKNNNINLTRVGERLKNNLYSIRLIENAIK